jgi:hypothetical protein
VIDWIVLRVRIEIDLILIPDRVGLQEPSQRRRVEPGLVMPQPELTDPRLAGIAEPALVAGIGDAPRVVGVDREDVARVSATETIEPWRSAESRRRLLVRSAPSYQISGSSTPGPWR